MKKYCFATGILLTMWTTQACNNPDNNQIAVSSNPSTEVQSSNPEQSIATEASNAEGKNDASDFVPEGFVIVEKIKGDINKDGNEDCILIIKATDKSEFSKDENRGILDKNRRGIIALLKKGDVYSVAVKNYNCFSSENEDGGIYFPPELDVSIKNGNVYIHYAHGRYGYWKYTFRYQNADLELIGYDASENNGPVALRVISINFLTQKKILKVNTNVNAETDGDEVFEEKISKIKKSKLVKLSEIKDFDNLEVE